MSQLLPKATLVSGQEGRRHGRAAEVWPGPAHSYTGSGTPPRPVCSHALHHFKCCSLEGLRKFLLEFQGFKKVFTVLNLPYRNQR